MDNREGTALLLSATVFNRARTVEEAVKVLRVWHKVLEEYGNKNFVLVPLAADRCGSSFGTDLKYLALNGFVQKAKDGGRDVYSLADRGRNALLAKRPELNEVLGFDIVALIGIDAKILEGKRSA